MKGGQKLEHKAEWMRTEAHRHLEKEDCRQRHGQFKGPEAGLWLT